MQRRNYSFEQTNTAGKVDDYWAEQKRIKEEIQRKGIEESQRKKAGPDMSQYGIYMREEYPKVVAAYNAEVDRQNARSGHSGNFLKDFVWGMKFGNKKFAVPFGKFVSKVPVVGSTIGGITGTISGVVDKL